MPVNLFDPNTYRYANLDLTTFSATQAQAHFQTSGITEGRIFSSLVDLNFYRASNPDLAVAGVTTNEQLLDHLQTYGIAEGRSFSPIVDLNFYRNSNPDLAAAGVTTNEQLFTHLQTYGVGEGRSFSQLLDLNFYLTVNSDVSQTYGGSRQQGLNHFRAYGLSEGRRFSQYVDLSFYLSVNSDLRQAFGSNREAALVHLSIHGLSEQRQFSQFFNLNTYQSANPDLVTARLSGRQLLEHFQQYGISEGRQFSSAFNLGYYRSVYSDLTIANLSDRQLYDHFQVYGLAEGRSSSPVFSVDYYLNNNPDLVTLGFNFQSAYDHFAIYGWSEGRAGTPTGSSLTGIENSAGLDFGLLGGTLTIEGSLTRSDRANPTRRGSYSDDYRITGLEVGQRLQLNLDAVGNEFDTYLQLVNAATGEVMDFDDDSGWRRNSQLSFNAEAEVDYIVRVTSYDSRAVGDYTLTADAQDTLTGSITGNQSLSGRLNASDFTNSTRVGAYRDDYQLTNVSAGQQIRVNLSTPSGFDPYLQVVDALTGEVIGSNDDYVGLGLNSQLDFTVQAGSTYVLRVTSYYENARGGYTLATTTLAPTIDADQSVSGFLSSTDPLNPLRADSYRDDYRLTGATVGERIRVNLNSTTFDPYLYLIDESTGAAIDFDDDSGSGLNSELTFTVQSGINYLLRVSSFDPDVTGNYRLVTTPLGGDWFTGNLQDSGLQAITRTLANDGILDRNDLLAIFRDAEDGGVISATEVTDLRTLVANSDRFRMPDYVEYLSARVADGTFANQSADQFESTVLGRWFLGTVAPTAQFRQENGRVYPLTYITTQGSLFGSSGQARIGDIDQGRLGDSAYLAALGATFGRQSNDGGNATSATINSMIIDNGDNTYTFRFYQGSTPQWVTVDRRLATFGGQLFGASANGSRSPSSAANVLWAPLAERAYAQWREGREGGSGYDLIGNGGSLSRSLQFVTGRTATNYSGSDITYAQLDSALRAGRAVEAVNFDSNTASIFGGQAYSVTNVFTTASGEQRVVVRNPWGVDGLQASGNPNDGFVDLSLRDFRTTFSRVAIA